MISDRSQVTRRDAYYINELIKRFRMITNHDYRFSLFELRDVIIKESNGIAIYTVLLQHVLNGEYYPLFFLHKDDGSLGFIYPNTHIHANTKEDAIQLFNEIQNCTVEPVLEKNNAFYIDLNRVIVNYLFGNTYTGTNRERVINKSPFTTLNPVTPFTKYEQQLGISFVNA